MLCALLLLAACLSKKAAEEIGQVVATDLRNAYIVELDNWAAAYPDSTTQRGICGYFVYDINGDSIPELCVVGGTCEADKRLGIYSYTLAGIDTLYAERATHVVLYEDEGALLCVAANGGQVSETRLTLVADSISVATVYEGLMSDEAGYADPTVPRAVLLPYDDRTAIESILQDIE